MGLFCRAVILTGTGSLFLGVFVFSPAFFDLALSLSLLLLLSFPFALGFVSLAFLGEDSVFLGDDSVFLGDDSVFLGDDSTFFFFFGGWKTKGGSYKGETFNIWFNVHCVTAKRPLHGPTKSIVTPAKAANNSRSSYKCSLKFKF